MLAIDSYHIYELSLGIVSYCEVIAVNEMMSKFFQWISEHPNQTELEIARGVGLKKTPYSRTILLALWQDGYIVRWYDENHQPRPAYKYFVQETQRMEGTL